MSKMDLKFDKKFDHPFRHKVEQHIQGIAQWGGVTIVSRNGQYSAETIHFGQTWQVRRKYSEAHIGGIDTTNRYMACGTYDPDSVLGHLYLYDLHSDRRQSIEITFRPYAVAIEQSPGADNIDGKYVVAVIAQPDGSEVRWFEYRHYNLKQLRHLGTTYFSPERGARNNICMHYVDGQLCLYTMRAHLGKGKVERYKIGGMNSGIVPSLDGTATMRAGLCSCRFGATIVLHNGREYLVKTGRNVWRGKLRVRKDKVRWDNKRGE